jgi:hypothetical protein
MKTIISLVAASLLVVSLAGVVYAQFMKGYFVVNVTEQSVIIKGNGGEEIEVPDKTGDFTKNQSVMYDKRTNKIKPYEGC